MEQNVMPAAGAPIPGGTPPAKKNNRTVVIVIVVLVILCICCCVVSGAGWFVGDDIMNMISPAAV
jgi:hypothetical protein